MANRALFGLSKRNALAESIITRYASTAITSTGTLGRVGLALPAGGLLTKIADIAVQAPAVHQPMARELAIVYAAQPDAILAFDDLSLETFTELRNPDSERLGAYLSGEFGYDFLSSLLTSMLPELGVGAATNLLPGALRALVGTGLDSTLAATLTWRIGMMAVLYALNDWRWIQSKDRTAALARKIIGKPTAKPGDRVQLQDILRRLPPLHAQAAAGLAQYVQEWRRTYPDATDASIREGLRRQGITSDLIAAAMKRA